MDKEKYRKYEMALLLSQTCLILELYYSKKSPKDSIKYINCYLVDKSDLDNFKNKYGYKKAEEYFKVYQEKKDYDTFKDKLSKAYNKNNIKRNFNNEKIRTINIEKNNLKENICLITEKFFTEFSDDFTKDAVPYSVCLWNKIIIIDFSNKEKNQFRFYFCEFKEDNNFDSYIEINDSQRYQFEDEEEKNKHINEIIMNKFNIKQGDNNINMEMNDNNNTNEPESDENKKMTNLIINNDNNQSKQIEHLNDYVYTQNSDNKMNQFKNSTNNTSNNFNMNNMNFNMNMNMNTNMINNSMNNISSYNINNQNNYGLNNLTNSSPNINMSNSNNGIFNNIQTNNMNQNPNMYQSIPLANNMNMNNMNNINNKDININQNNNSTQFPNNNMNGNYQNFINNSNYQNFMNNSNNNMNPNFMNPNNNMYQNYTNQNNNINQNYPNQNNNTITNYPNQKNNMNINNNFTQFPNNNNNFMFNGFNGNFNNS